MKWSFVCLISGVVLLICAIVALVWVDVVRTASRRWYVAVAIMTLTGLIAATIELNPPEWIIP